MSPFIAALSGALIAGSGAFVAGLFMRRKTKAEATAVSTQAAERVVRQLTSALDQADATAQRLDKEVADLKAEIRRLRQLVVSLGGDPRHEN